MSFFLPLPIAQQTEGRNVSFVPFLNVLHSNLDMENIFGISSLEVYRSVKRCEKKQEGNWNKPKPCGIYCLALYRGAVYRGLTVQGVVRSTKEEYSDSNRQILPESS